MVGAREGGRVSRKVVHPVGEDGLWRQVLRPVPPTRRLPTLFLDRDGTIVEDVGHLCRPSEVVPIAGAAATIRAANDLGVPVVIVTNQSGIGRGLFGWDDFAGVQARILALLAAEGAAIDAVLACPHHPEAAAPWRHPDHPARKPNAGMLLRAARLLPIALGLSWIAGDRATDLAAGKAAGLAGGLHLDAAWDADAGERRAAALLAEDGFRVELAPSLASAPLLSSLFQATGGLSALAAAEEEEDQARP